MNVLKCERASKVLPLKLSYISVLCSRFLYRKDGLGVFDVISKEERANFLTVTTDCGLSSLTMGICSEVQGHALAPFLDFDIICCSLLNNLLI